MFNREINENGVGDMNDMNSDGTNKKHKSHLLTSIGKRVTAGLGIVAIAAAMALGCAGCDAGDAARVLQDVSEIATTIDESGVFDGNGNGGTVAENESSADYQWTEWDADKYPDYYRIVGKAVVDSDVPEGEIWYSDLDELGRTQRAVGRITYDMREEAKERGRLDFPSDADPSGWGHNEQLEIPLSNGKTYHGWCWNRGHEIPSAALGSYERNNLYCSTRLANVGSNDGNGGVQYFENMMIDYLDNNEDGVVYYSVTPVYQGDELVPRSIFIDIKSNDGSIDLQGEVFNTLGDAYTIDYSDGSVTKN